MNFLKFATLLALFALMDVVLARDNSYKFVLKQSDDSKYFLLKSASYDMPLQAARDACKSFGYRLAEIHSADTYEYINKLFCPPNR